MRIVLAQTIDRILFEKGNLRRCHKWIHTHNGIYFTGITYGTYLTYLKNEKYNNSVVIIPNDIVEMFKTLKVIVHVRKLLRKPKAKPIPKPASKQEPLSRTAASEAGKELGIEPGKNPSDNTDKRAAQALFHFSGDENPRNLLISGK